MRILLKISYNGAGFQGFQIQNEGRTVQYELERILKRMHRQFVRIHPSSRTDRGVHALSQYVHFDTPMQLTPEKWQHAFNSALPDDIYVLEVREIPESYHSRYDCIGKAYRYKVYQDAHRDVMKTGLETYYPYEVALEPMQQAAQYFLGTHDFTSFCSAKTEIENKERTIYQFTVEQTADGYDFRVIGSGFLYNMVRIMVQHLLDVGQGGKAQEDTKTILAANNRQYAGKTAPAEGLYLEKIYLTPEELKADVGENIEIHMKKKNPLNT